MKKILALITVLFVFISCKNSLEKEHQQVVDLQKVVDNSEDLLSRADTAEIFSYVRELKQDLWDFSKTYDSIDKETTFLMAEYYGNKKSLYYLYDNYDAFSKGIVDSRKQLINLKTDLDNKIINQKQFEEYYNVENLIILEMDDKINKSLKSVDFSMGRLKASKEEVKQRLAKFRVNQ